MLKSSSSMAWRYTFLILVVLAASSRVIPFFSLSLLMYSPKLSVENSFLSATEQLYIILCIPSHIRVRCDPDNLLEGIHG